MNNMASLVDLVKWCVLDTAFINGKPVEDCLGNVSKSINYNGIKQQVETYITKDDIASYGRSKNISFYV